MMEIRTFQLSPLVQRGHFFYFLKLIFRGPMKWDWCLLIKPWHVTYHFTGVFQTKTIEISKFCFRTTMVQGGKIRPLVLNSRFFSIYKSQHWKGCENLPSLHVRCRLIQVDSTA